MSPLHPFQYVECTCPVRRGGGQANDRAHLYHLHQRHCGLLCVRAVHNASTPVPAFEGLPVDLLGWRPRLDPDRARDGPGGLLQGREIGVFLLLMAGCSCGCVGGSRTPG